MLFVWILPLILNIALAIFLRTCCVRENDGRVPRIVCYAEVVIAFVPILSWIELVVVAANIWGRISEGSLNLKHNRFTAYWFRD